MRAGAALPAARWPGRLELLETTDGTPGGALREVLLDGAHNPAGAAALARALDDLRPTLQGGDEPDPAPVTLILATMADKDVAGVLAALASSPVARSAQVICTQVDLPRALPAAEPGQGLGRGRAGFAADRRPARPGRARAGIGGCPRADRRRRVALPGRGGAGHPRRRSGAARRTGRRRARHAGRARSPRRDPMSGRSAAPLALGSTRIGSRTFRWGERTFVMGIVNVTPDSFSGDGLLGVGGRRRSDRPGGRARPSGWSPRAPTCSTSAASRPGPATRRSPRPRRSERVIPVVAAIHAALPDVADQRRHDQARGRRGGARRGRDAAQRHLGGRCRRRPGPARRGARRARSSSCTTAPSRATRTSCAEIVADLERAIERRRPARLSRASR